MTTTAQIRGARLPTVLDGFTNWLDRFGETSYDHQSYFAGPLGGRAKALYYRNTKFGALAVGPMIASEALFPAARQVFWKKQRFPIADAHYAMGFAYLAHSSGDVAHHSRAVHFLQELEQTRCAGYRHAGWGYPFDWVTRNGVMKAQTPLITSTPYIYEAFAAVHRIDGNRRWLQVMESAAEHAFTEIPDKVLSDDEATCAYNPHDTEFRVINASAYRAFLLLAAAEQFDRDDYRQAAQRNLNFVLRAQKRDGSWPYATDGVRSFVDHFHTCFVLKALAKIEAITGDAAVRQAIGAGVAYYVQHLFDEQGLPRPFAVAPRLTIYGQELYDYAGCINLATLLRGSFPALDEWLAGTLTDQFARWQEPDRGRVVADVFVQALRGEPITIYGDGSQARSFCFVDDLVDGLPRLMRSPVNVTGLINLGNPTEPTVLELAERIIEMTNSNPQIDRHRCPCTTRRGADPTPRWPGLNSAGSPASRFAKAWKGASATSMPCLVPEQCRRPHSVHHVRRHLGRRSLLVRCTELNSNAAHGSASGSRKG